MQISQGFLVWIYKSIAGQPPAQVVGMDTKYLGELIAKHGKDGSWDIPLTADGSMWITVEHYSERRKASEWNMQCLIAKVRLWAQSRKRNRVEHGRSKDTIKPVSAKSSNSMPEALAEKWNGMSPSIKPATITQAGDTLPVALCELKNAYCIDGFHFFTDHTGFSQCPKALNKP